MKTKAYIYDSFTEKKFKGNQAAVVISEKKLTEENMKNIAREFNYSETVFLFESDKAFKKVRFFTPNSEVDLCGHATIAYIQCLFDNNILKLEEGKNIVNFETNLGVLPITINKKEEKIENIMMYQDDGKIEKILEENYFDIMESLNLTMEDLGEFKIVKGYTGLWDLLIHLKNKKSLDKINIDTEKMKNLSKKLNIISFHPFVLEENIKKEKEAYVRNFAPIVDIDEEAATGTSNGALAFYLYQKKYLKEGEYLTCFQGKSMGRESKILAQIIKNKVLVGGNAVKILEGELTI
ncbi:MAG: PhzF family phenazine biosynthesis protein [Fusobacterium sp.]|nr:PhzF family phenazine biosynthesis protein [Fusobacterium sp.]